MAPIVLAVIVLGAAAFALIRPGGSVPELRSDAPRPSTGQASPSTESPSVRPTSTAQASPQQSGATTIQWKVPSNWRVAPNPSAMRLATYRVPAAGGAEEAEMSVSRAGGTTPANIERWRGQFDGANQTGPTEKTVAGLKVTIVEITGTFTGGGMMGGPTTQHPGWALLGAIVETGAFPYFFKLTGPQASVLGARQGFDELIDSVTPQP